MSSRSGGGCAVGGCGCARPRLSADFVAAATGGRWLREVAATRECGGADAADGARASNGDGRAGFSGVGIDSREVRPSSLFVAVRGDRHDGHDHVAAASIAGAAAAMVSREIDLAGLPPGFGVLRVADTVAAMQRLAGAWRRTLSCVVVGITGSAGKTTTRRLVHAAISGAIPAVQSPKSFNNHLGVPLTLLSAEAEHGVVVAEIGMNAPGEIAALAEIAAPEVAAVTTVGRAHLEGVGSLAGVAREKSDLLRRVRAGACPPLALAPLMARPGGCAAIEPYLLGVPGLCRFGDAEQAHVRLLDRRPHDDGQEIHVRCAEPGRAAEDLTIHLRLPGRHNAINALIAVAVARHLAVELADRLTAPLDGAAIAGALSRVAPDAMRFQPDPVVLEPQSPPAFLVNDAYNANPESMAAALATFAEVCGKASRRLLVLGDMLELGPAGEALHAELAERIVETHRQAPLSTVVLVGPLMARAAEVLAGSTAFAGVQLLHHGALDPARAAAIAELLRPGDAMLLKGSRGMAIERVAAAVAARSGGTAAAAH